MNAIKKYTDIPFAHRQHTHKGHCSLLHGHNWSVELSFYCAQHDENGFVVDFGKLQCVEHILKELDHALVLSTEDSLLKEPWYLDFLKYGYARVIEVPGGASCENLAQWLHQKIDNAISTYTNNRVRLQGIRLYEDEKNSVYYEPL